MRINLSLLVFPRLKPRIFYRIRPDWNFCPEKAASLLLKKSPRFLYWIPVTEFMVFLTSKNYLLFDCHLNKNNTDDIKE